MLQAYEICIHKFSKKTSYRSTSKFILCLDIRLLIAQLEKEIGAFCFNKFKSLQFEQDMLALVAMR